MDEWTIHIEGAAEGVDEARAGAILEALAAYAPAVSYGHGRIGATLTVAAPTPQQAITEALTAFAAASDAAVAHVEADLAA